MLDWNDLRYFLSVAREGSTLAAARALRVSQTTVARRVAALEETLDIPLFDKRQAGYALTPAGEDLVRHAEDVERAATGFSKAAEVHSREMAGTVCLTTHEMFTATILAPMLRELRELHPEILIDVDSSEEYLDLGAGAADIAIRSTNEKQPAGIVGRPLCADHWTLYCSSDYAERHGLPQSREELKQHALIGGGEPGLWRLYQAFLREFDLEDNVAIHYPSSTGLLSGIRAGMGIGVLPCVIADGERDLIRCFPPREFGRTLWLLTHERVRHTPRVRAVVDFLYDRLSRHIRQLEREREAAAAA